MSKPSFNADVFADAIAGPSFTFRGRTYVGRPISVEQWVLLHAQGAAVADAPETPLADVRALTRRLVAAWFPRRWYQLGNPAVRAFERMPDVAQVAAMRSFSAAQRRAIETLSATTATAPSAAPRPSAT